MSHPKQYIITPDTHLDQKKVENIKDRDVSQLYNYLGEWAHLYLTQRKLTRADLFWQWISAKLYADMIKTFAIAKNSRIAMISLGCGDSVREKETLEILWKEYKIDYFGVDASDEMIQVALQNHEDLNNVTSLFLTADFSSSDFRNYIHNKTKGYGQRIFLLFGNTLGNITQTRIVDTLYNVMQPGDYLWIDVAMRSGTDQASTVQDAQYFSRYATSESVLPFLIYPLTAIWIDTSKWEIGMDFSLDKSLDATLYRFKYTLNENITCILNGERLHISKWEEIKLIKMYNYSRDGLINFFSTRDFELIWEDVEWRLGIFLFQRT